MASSLYDISVACYLQTLGAVSAFLDRGLAHFTANGVDPDVIAETRIHPDMEPLRFQINSIRHHSLGAVEALRTGEFGSPAPTRFKYREMQDFIAETRTALQAVKAEEIDGYAGRDMAFAIGDRKLPFTAETFVLSLSLPNFHFHCTTAYDILRASGVPIGKVDYMGRLRLKR